MRAFENPYTDPKAAQKIASSPVSAARADEAHRKSIVLLRNDQKLLPMTGAKKLYVEVMAGQPARAEQRATLSSWDRLGGLLDRFGPRTI